MNEISPLLAIQCMAYNHEPYIRQCLDGFVMQKTTFPFIAIVHDDASTDKTPEIIREYAKKYPNIIKPIFESENQYSKHDGTIRRKMNSAIPESVRYIALCEGDDYWIDPQKLQKQVDFLEKNQDYSFSSTAVQLYDSYTNKKVGIASVSNNVATFDIVHAIKGFGHIASTPSFLFRNNIIAGNLPNFFEIAPCSDYPLPILASLYGKIVNLPDETSVHRVLSKGSNTSRWRKDFSKREEYNIKFEKMLDELDSYTEYKYHKLIEEERFGLWFRSYLAAEKYSKIRNMKAVRYVFKQPGIVKFKLFGKVFPPFL